MLKYDPSADFSFIYIYISCILLSDTCFIYCYVNIMISMCQQVLEFGALEKSMIKFLRMTMMHLLTSTSTSDLNLIFRRVGQLQKLRALSDGLRMFLTKYIKVKKLDGDQMKIVKDKLSEVCGELSLNRQTVL